MQGNREVHELARSAALALAGALLLSGCAVPAPAAAEAGQGSIHGQVWRSSTCGRKLSAEEEKTLACGPRPQSVVLHVQALDTAWSADTRSDAEGHYRIAVPAGRYRLSVAAEGLLSAAQVETAVAAGEDKELWLQRASRAK